MGSMGAGDVVRWTARGSMGVSACCAAMLAVAARNAPEGPTWCWTATAVAFAVVAVGSMGVGWFRSRRGIDAAFALQVAGLVMAASFGGAAILGADARCAAGGACVTHADR